jgi:hypothetical protein
VFNEPALLLPAVTLLCPGFASHTLAQNSPELQTPADAVAVTGTIFSEDGRQRLDNAMVNLCDRSGNLIQQGSAGGGGYFAFRGLRQNEYVLKVTADSYQTCGGSREFAVRIPVSYVHLHETDSV